MASSPDLKVRPDVRQFLDFIAAAGRPQAHELSPSEAREQFAQMRFLVDAEPEPLPVIRDLSCPGPGGRIPLRYYDAREERGPTAAILFIHGGGFVIGDLDTHHPFCTHAAKHLDLPLIAVDYRLAPEHPFPAGPEDCVAAARWLASSPEALGLTVTGLVPMGDSAGGNLAIVVTQALARQPAEVPVIAQVPIYPVVDSAGDYPSIRECGEGFMLTADVMRWFGDNYAADEADERNSVIRNDHRGTPPTYIVTAGLDPLRDQGRAYVERLKQAGGQVRHFEAEGNIHGFICMRKAIPSSVADIDRMMDEIGQLLKDAGAHG